MLYSRQSIESDINARVVKMNIITQLRGLTKSNADDISLFREGEVVIITREELHAIDSDFIANVVLLLNRRLKSIGIEIEMYYVF